MRLAILISLLATGLCWGAEDGGTIPKEHQAILPGGKWQPSDEQCQTALKTTDDYLQRQLKEAAGAKDPDRYRYRIEAATFIVKNFPRYGVQFTGREKDGKRILHINFFLPGAANLDKWNGWRENEMLADGGGYGFWNIDYDVEGKQCVNFDVNAPE